MSTKKFGPRHRSEILTQPVEIVWTTYSTGPDGPPVTSEVLRGWVPSDTVVMNDIVQKDFAKRIAAGEVISNPMFRVESTYIYHPGTQIDRYYEKPYAGWSGTASHSGMCHGVHMPELFPVVVPPADSLAYYRQRAVDRAFAKANGETFSTLVDLFELPETVAMVVKLLKRLKGLREVIERENNSRRRRRRRRRLRLANVLTLGKRIDVDSLVGGYLEWRFGWSPLIKSLYDLAEALSNSVQDRGIKRLTYRATEKYEFAKTSDKDVPQVLYSTTVGYARYSTECAYKGAFRAGILIDVDIGLVAKEFGLRAQDLPSAAWDLVPYSFVVDRVLDVGTWIRSITLRNSTTVKASWVTERSTLKMSYITQPMELTASTGSGSSLKRTTKSRQESRYTTEFKVVQRWVHAQPSLLPKLDPSLRTFTNFTHLLDYVALIMARVKR